MVRRYHDATASFVPPSNAVWVEQIGHPAGGAASGRLEQMCWARQAERTLNMPIHEYRCENCGHVFEHFARGSGGESGPPRCSSCESSTLTRLLSAFAVGGRAAAARDREAGVAEEALKLEGVSPVAQERD